MKAMSITKTICITLILILAGVLPCPAGDGPQLFHSPAQNADITTNSPDIRLSLIGTGADAESLRVYVNGQDVTSQAVRSFAFVSYTPADPLPQGENHVRITYQANDEAREVKWSFNVSSPEIIHSISHDGDDFMTLGQVLTVTVQALPGSSGRFDLSHIARGIPLSEGPDGVFKGSHKIQEGDYLHDGTITVMMTGPDGSRQTKTIDAPPWISASFFRVQITSPKPGQYVDRIFEVRGTTTPDVLVNISSKLGFNFTKEDAMASGGPAAGGYRTRSDENGNFSQQIGFPPIVIQGMKMLIYVQATDSRGNRSIPDQAIVHYRPVDSGQGEDPGQSHPAHNDTEDRESQEP